MSAETLELMRLSYEAFNRGDVDAWLELLDPEIELQENVLAPDVAVYRGLDGVRDWMRIGTEAFKDAGFEVEQLIDSGDAVVAVVRARGHGAGSDAPFEARIVHGARCRDGRCYFIASYHDLGEAFRALGIDQQAGP